MAILTTLMITLAVGSATTPATADTGDGGGHPRPGGRIINDSPEAIVVLSPGGPTHEISHRGTARRGRWECHYYMVGGIPGSSEPAPLLRQGPINPKRGDPVLLQCVDENGGIAFRQVFVFDPANPLAGLDLPARAAEEARKLVVIATPTIRLSPPVGSTQLVGVPTWLWLAHPWSPVQASATLGGVTATVTAYPRSVAWSLTDGPGVTCNGPGTPYDDTRSPTDQASDCTILLQRRGRHLLTATVTYATGWTASTGQSEPLDAITRSATVPVTVAEAQALIR